MAYLTVDQLVSLMVPQLARTPGRLTAVFSTYNYVEGYPAGPVETGDPDFVVHVATGSENRIASTFVLEQAMGAGTAASDPRGTVQAIEREAATAARVMSRDVEAHLPTQPGKTFLLQYAGITAFKECLDWLGTLATRGPNMEVAVLTCNCEQDRKLALLQPLLESNAVQSIVLTPSCGGTFDMQRVLNALLVARGSH